MRFRWCQFHRLIYDKKIIDQKHFTLFIAISREDGEDSNHHNHHRGHGNNHNSKVPFNGYNSEEFLDRLEPNGNIPVNKSDLGYSKRKYLFTASLSLTKPSIQCIMRYHQISSLRYHFLSIENIFSTAIYHFIDFRLNVEQKVILFLLLLFG